MKKAAWVIAVDMGYGHQRTAHPLRHLAFGGKVINANNYEGISEQDRMTWKKAKEGYEFISAFGRIPIIGPLVFGAFNKIQRILTFYPKRDLSKPNLQLRQTLVPINKGWGEYLIKKLSKNPKIAIPVGMLPLFLLLADILITLYFILLFFLDFTIFPLFLYWYYVI